MVWYENNNSIPQSDFRSYRCVLSLCKQHVCQNRLDLASSSQLFLASNSPKEFDYQFPTCYFDGFFTLPGVLRAFLVHWPLRQFDGTSHVLVRKTPHVNGLFRRLLRSLATKNWGSTLDHPRWVSPGWHNPMMVNGKLLGRSHPADLKSGQSGAGVTGNKLLWKRPMFDG